MRYLSVCSGIEAASVAWHHLGWKPVGFSEIEAFPSAVLAHRFPNVPNFGDMTRHAEWNLGPGSVDLLVGGTPCQSFSVAGLRKGLSDSRGGLMLTYLEIARRLRPRWIVWENVPGVLSSGSGRDLGAFLGALGELGYGWAYRVLDAQWVRTQRHPRAVPQRRRRIFVVGCLGDATAAAQVLFERESVCRDSASRRASREGAAADAEAGARAGRWPAPVSCTLNHAFGTKLGLEDQHALGGAPMFVPSVVGSLTAKGPTAMGAPEVDAHHYIARPMWWNGEDCAGTLTKQNANGGQRMPDKDNFGAVLQPVTVRSGSIGEFVQDDVGETMRATGGDCQGGSESLVLQLVASTLGNRGLRSHTELDGHGAYVPVMSIQGAATRANPASGPDGIGVSQSGVSYTLEARSEVQAVAHPVAFRKSRRAQSVNDHETWVAAEQSNTLNQFDTGERDTHAVLGTDCYNGAITGDVAATMGTPGSSVNATGPTVMQSHGFYSTGGTHGLNQHPEVSPAVKVGSGLGIPSPPAVAQAMTVRRLTPRECERLQGFPDDWTMIPWRKKPAEDCPDGPRYKALGNSMAVNVMAWIGERIAGVEARSAGNP